MSTTTARAPAVQRVNEAIRFLLELALLAALAYSAGTIGTAMALQVVAAVAAPLAVAALWGALIAPASRYRLTDPGRLILELLLFASAASGLAVAGRSVLAAILLGLTVANAVLLRVAYAR